MALPKKMKKSSASAGIHENASATDTISNGNNLYAPKDIAIEDLIEYRKRGLSLPEIAKLEGCSHQNVHERLKKANLEGLDKFRDNKDAVFEHKQREIVNCLNADKLKDMSGLQLITGAAILQDKIQVIRGQASDIVEHRTINASLDEITERMRSAGMLQENGNS